MGEEEGRGEGDREVDLKLNGLVRSPSRSEFFLLFWFSKSEDEQEIERRGGEELIDASSLSARVQSGWTRWTG